MGTRRLNVSKLPLPAPGSVALGTLEDLVRRHPDGRLELVGGEVVFTAPKPKPAELALPPPVGGP